MKTKFRSYVTWICILGMCVGAAAQQAWPTGSKTVAEKLGYPADARLLVIEAEDLGMAHSVDKASFEESAMNFRAS